MSHYPSEAVSSFALLTDTEAERWLIEIAGKNWADARSIVDGCRAYARARESSDERPCHALGNVSGVARLVSKIAIVDHPRRPQPPSAAEVAAPATFAPLPPDFVVQPGSLEDVAGFAYAEAVASAENPFGGRTICLATVCQAGDQLILDWNNGALIVGHKNILAYSYGCVPRFATFFLGVTSAPPVR